MALSALACQRKEEARETKQSEPVPAESPSSAAPAAGEKQEAPDNKPTKASVRPPVTEKKIPVAEPLPDKPGFVKSPFSGQIIDVQGIPGGTLVADPMFPMEEKKYFRVPKLDPEQEARAREELARALNAAHDAPPNVPEARPVPGKAGFFFSPYDNKVIDAKGFEPGALVPDPGAPEGESRFFRIPGAVPDDSEGKSGELDPGRFLGIPKSATADENE